MSSVAAITDDVAGDPLDAQTRPWWIELGSVVPRSVAYSIRASKPTDLSGIPRLQPTPLTWATVAIDELALSAAYLSNRAGGKVVGLTAQRDATRAVTALRKAGFVSDPKRLYETPATPTDVRITRRSASRIAFEHLSFDSTWRPPIAGLPVEDMWTPPHGNGRAHAYLLRHGDRPRPTVIMLHGTMMGEPRDVRFLGSKRIRDELGVDVAHLVLPMHGPRSRESGHPFPGLDPVLNLVGMSQAIHDVRALIAWLRAAGSESIGVFGISLGGHVAALLAGVEPAIDCVVTGVPTSDHSTMLADMLRAHWGEETVASTHVLDKAQQTLSTLVSPLNYAPVVPHDRLFIYAAIGDRLVTPEQALALWRHWDEPSIKWLQGGHIINNIRATRRFVISSLRESGVTGR